MNDLKGPSISEIKQFIKDKTWVEFHTLNEKVFNNAINLIYVEPYPARRVKARGISKVFCVFQDNFLNSLLLPSQINLIILFSPLFF